MTSEQPHFLVVDRDPDGRFLILATLIRRYPHGVISDCQTSQTALQMARKSKLTAIIVHNAVDMDGAEMTAALREVQPDVPIVMLSTLDKKGEALAAGATEFLLTDEWLRLGGVLTSIVPGARAVMPPHQAEASGL
jgi:CheY-like chemotaxis protein